MSYNTYNSDLHEEVRQWFLDNPQDDSDAECNDIPPWNKGIKGQTHSKKTRLKMSKSHKDQVPWNKGLSMSEKTKEKISQTKKGVTHSDEHKRKNSEAQKKVWIKKKLAFEKVH